MGEGRRIHAHPPVVVYDVPFRLRIRSERRLHAALRRCDGVFELSANHSRPHGSDHEGGQGTQKHPSVWQHPDEAVVGLLRHEGAAGLALRVEDRHPPRKRVRGCDGIAGPVLDAKGSENLAELTRPFAPSSPRLQVRAGLVEHAQFAGPSVGDDDSAVRQLPGVHDLVQLVRRVSLEGADGENRGFADEPAEASLRCGFLVLDDRDARAVARGGLKSRASAARALAGDGDDGGGQQGGTRSDLHDSPHRVGVIRARMT